MIEQYVIDEIKQLKEENFKLKEEIIKNQSEPFKWVEAKIYDLELIGEETIIKTLEENNYKLEELESNYSSEEYINIIKKHNLYREKLNRKKNNYEGIVKYKNKYYGLETYYGGFKFDDIVYIDLDTAIYHELTDELYDVINQELRKRKQEEKGE